MSNAESNFVVSKTNATNLPLKITGIVFWGMVLIGILISWFLIKDYQKTLLEKYDARAQIAAFSVSKTLIQNPTKDLQQLKSVIEEIRKENLLAGIQLTVKNSSLIVGEFSQTCDTRIINILSPGSSTESLSVCMPKTDETIATYRKNILISMSILFFSFGFVLQSILQKLLTKPFVDMVNTANNISHGKTNERFFESRDDEFGFLSKFINQALDTQIEQSREIAHAEQTSKAKSIFLANMSHELRTPLNAIIGYSEILNEDISDDRQRSDLNRIIQSGRHLLNLINDLLDLSKIEAGKVDLSIEKISIPLLINEVVDTVQPIIGKNNNRIKVYCPPGVLFINSDHTKIKQVLFNLLSNASKFTENGTISLRVVVPDENKIQFDITDTGIGMSEEQISNIFNAFSQADGSIQKRFGGTGLGLVISKHYAKLLGGDISVESTSGVGSTFTFYLPIKNSAAQAKTQDLMVRQSPNSLHENIYPISPE